MKTYKLLIGLVLVMFLLSSCAAKSDSAPGMAIDVYQPMPESPALEESYDSGSKVLAGVTSAEAPPTQMIMMNASLTIIVDEPASTLREIQNMAEKMGGFTVSSNLYRTWTPNNADLPQADLTIRVPAKRLTEAMENIKAMTDDPKKFVLRENISGQDVTKEFTDLNSRLRNLQEADAKLSELYAQAETTEDALAIFTQKVQITEQIEVITGQIQYYEDSVSTSAISIQIQSKESIEPVTIGGWTPSAQVRNALQALINVGKGLVNVLIWMVILVVPILLVIGLPIYLLVRWLKRRNTARKQAVVAQWLKDNPSENVPPIPDKQD